MSEELSVTDLRIQLAEAGDLNRIPQLKRYFQAYDGGYGEGDRFLGVRVPDCRRIARAFRKLPLSAVEALLQSPYHEERLTGLFILVEKYAKASPPERQVVVRSYLDNRVGIDNWDLVDSSADKILGRSVLEGVFPERVVEELAASENLWDNRIAMLSTFAHIRAGNFELPLRIAQLLLSHPHDLIHKAVGWMLREIIERDEAVGTAFVEEHAAAMPRTMLRYAVEKLPKPQRARLQGQIPPPEETS